MSLFVNDPVQGAPQLRVYMNLDSLADLGGDTVWGNQRLDDALSRDTRLFADGFEGVQLTQQFPQHSSLLPFCGSGRIDTPAQASLLVQQHQARGDICLTVHVGTGLEDDAEAFRLVEATLNASHQHQFPVFIETHRATITQDIWRTVQLTKRFPEIRFNADFSHYYCGQEMPYGDWNSKLEFMKPVFERVGFVHGRVASSGCMQVPVTSDITQRHKSAHGLANYQDHFQQLWSCAVRGFLRTAKPGDVLIFAPELLDHRYDYARLIPNEQSHWVEESDRYAQALLYQRWIRQIFQQEAP